MSYQLAMQEADKLRKGPWLVEEDKRLTAIVALLGERRWDAIARASGLRRSGKSCRLRWLNYLRPNLKHYPISPAEEQIILQLHEQWGNKWSRIARRLPGRTDNEIKNYWRTHLRKKTESQDQGQDNAKQDFMKQNHDTTATETSYQDCNSVAGIWGTTDTDHFLDVFGSPLNSRIAYSPYESLMSDWVLGFSDDKIGFDHHGDCTSSEDQTDQYSCFYTYTLWNTEDHDETSLWDCSDSLWDLD